jgi:putative spermidine/putrescine transport system permease protein
MRRPGNILLILFGGLTLFFLVAPMLVIVFASFDPGDFFTFPPESFSARWYHAFLHDHDWRNALTLSLTIAALTGLAATIIGGFAGIAVGRIAPRWRRPLYPLLIAPLAVPSVVLAIAFYGIVLRLHLVGTLFAFVTANTLLTAPLVALLVAGAASGIDPWLEYASLSCGYGRFQTVLRVTAPLIAPTAIAGGVLAALLTLDEVVMSIFLVAPGRTPLAVMMYLQVQTGTPPIVTAASSLLIGASVAIIVVLTVLRYLLGLRGRSVTTAALTSETEAAHG